MHMPCPKNSSAWQKRRQKQRCREVLAASPHLQPPALSHASPSVATREPQSPPVPAASSLSLNQAVAAEWELWPMLMSDVLLSVKTFSQLITENIRSFSLNPSAAFLHPLPQGNSDAIQGGTGDPSVDLHLCQGSWLSSAPLGSTRGAPGCSAPSTRSLWESSPGPHPQLRYPETSPEGSHPARVLANPCDVAFSQWVCSHAQS